MAKVSYVNIPAGLEGLYAKALQPVDRFEFSRVSVKRQFLSRAIVKGITQRSLFVSLAPIWAAMSPTEQAAWAAAGASQNYSGWKMFVQDTSYRMKAGVSGYATPSTIYQCNVGRIEVVAPATGLQIEQPHPSSYFVQKKVAGTKAQYAPVEIYEPFSLPLTIGISYHTDLIAEGASPRARFFCNVISSYQGLDIVTPVAIDFGLSDAWQHATATLSTVVGLPRYYEAYIEVYNARGNLYFDDVNIYHGAENWARDPRCLNIDEGFTRAFFQVPAHWAPTNLSDGAQFDSFYFVP